MSGNEQKTKMPMSFEEKVIAFLIANLVICALTLIISLVILISPRAEASSNPPKLAKPSADALIPSKEYRKFDDYSKAVQDKSKLVAVVFYADWCSYCRRSVPIFLDLAENKELKEMYNFTFVNGDIPGGGVLMRQYGANGYPSLFVLNPENDEKLPVANEIIFGMDPNTNIIEEMKALHERLKG